MANGREDKNNMKAMAISILFFIFSMNFTMLCVGGNTYSFCTIACAFYFIRKFS